MKSVTLPKIYLDSDFRDYYDHWFEPFYNKPHDGVALIRQSIAKEYPITKAQQFMFMSELGLDIPVIEDSPSLFLALMDRVNAIKPEYLVIYNDQYAHRGEGKLKVRVDSDLSEYDRCLTSVYIQTSKNRNKAISKRLLAIGENIFWLQYENKDDWRSNYGGDIKIKTLCTLNTTRDKYFSKEAYDKLNSYPLFAIDFVSHWRKRDTLIAIDFNSAPGISGTPIEYDVSARDVFKLVSEFMNKDLIK